MRNTVIWSFLSLLALATGGLVTGCDSDAKIAKSSPGESCTKTSDCNDGLKCLNGTCYSSSSVIDKSGDGGESGGDEPIFVPPIPPNLGKLGETCTKRSDCDDGLACLSSRCSDDETVGAGGSGNGPGPTLGGPGETCGLTTDCADGLACLPTEVYLDSYGSEAKALGNGGGVCTPLDSGIRPTGNSCAECVEAEDCCELPIAEQEATGAKSCTQLAALVADVADCAVATATAGRYCLDYAAYCGAKCTAWACDAGQCQYTAKCTKAGNVVGGCPAYTRTGTAVSPCDTKASKCLPVADCKKDVDCDGGTIPVFDDPADLCVDDECTCHVDSGHCYRKCSEDLDCAIGYSCDTDLSVCVKGDNCASDVQCAVRTGDVRSKCVEGDCTVTCEHDVDCNPGGLHGGFSQVCGPDQTCVPVGCSEDNECAFAGNVRGFCTESSDSAGAPVVASAITD